MISGQSDSLRALINTAVNHVLSITGLQLSTVVGVSRAETNWVIAVELVEKRSIPDSMDILGLYEVTVDGRGQMIGFSRKSLRKRGDTEKSV